MPPLFYARIFSLVQKSYDHHQSHRPTAIPDLHFGAFAESHVLQKGIIMRLTGVYPMSILAVLNIK